MSKHTPGPWRWEINRQSKVLHLVGGIPRYDLTIMDFSRWGMNRAVATLRETSEDGMNIMHRLPDRQDWIAPFPGREHHSNWCASVVHPDMQLMEAAPNLLASLKIADAALQSHPGGDCRDQKDIEAARAAIAKAEGK